VLTATQSRDVSEFLGQGCYVIGLLLLLLP